MTALASTFAPTVTVKVYKNGNPNFLGKTMVINRRHIRSMEALYDEVTLRLSAFNAVRKICTPIGGRPVQNLEGIQNKSVYVAAGREEFKKLNYADLGTLKPRPPRKGNFSPKKIVTEGRHKMDYEWGKRDLKILHVFCNGDVFKPSVKIVLQKRLQQSMEQILNIVQDHVVLAAAIAALYTIDGNLVFTPGELVTGGLYVAVERGKPFKRENYGGSTSVSRSPRAAFLPPIGNGQLIQTGSHRLTKKQGTRKKRQKTKANGESKINGQSSDQSFDTNVMSVTSPNDTNPNSSPHPRISHALLRASVSQDLESVNNFTISSSPPRWLEDDSPIPEDTSLENLEKTDNDKDEGFRVGSVFKASGMLQEEADEIKDMRQTKKKKTLDSLPAEEVMEEVVEQIENTGETISDKSPRRGDQSNDEGEKHLEITDDSNVEQFVGEVIQSQIQVLQDNAPRDEFNSKSEAESTNKNTSSGKPRKKKNQEKNDKSSLKSKARNSRGSRASHDATPSKTKK